MNKQVKKAFNKKIYLLGTRASDGRNVWLEAPSWDCGWYWGFGYLETYTNNSNPEHAKDVCTHSHFKGDIINEKSNAFDNFKKYFSDTVLTDDEIWKLCDYMTTFYTLKETAELFKHGYSYFTERAKIETLKDETLTDRINKEMLPALFEKIESMLTK